MTMGNIIEFILLAIIMVILDWIAGYNAGIFFGIGYLLAGIQRLISEDERRWRNE